MKKTTSKLALRTETIKLLDAADLGRVVGGTLPPISKGFIMKDTIIIRTGG